MNKPKAPTYFEARKWASFRIQNYSELDMYDVDFLLQKRFGFSTADMLIHYHDQMPPDRWQQFQTDLNQLLLGKPVQYIVQQADFYGMTLTVNQHVLIPRVETEELVDWILSETNDKSQEPLSVLDIGTGSGAIAIALKKNRPDWQLSASDISTEALKVAEENAKNQGTTINFIVSDVFTKIKSAFDIIVSNPPYIATNEVAYMDRQVLNYEPKIALFAADKGLAIYKRLAEGLSSHLKPAGKLFVEIGFRQESAVEHIFKTQLPKSKVRARHDITGNQRMIELDKGDK